MPRNTAHRPATPHRDRAAACFHPTHRTTHQPATAQPIGRTATSHITPICTPRAPDPGPHPPPTRAAPALTTGRAPHMPSPFRIRHPTGSHRQRRRNRHQRRSGRASRRRPLHSAATTPPKKKNERPGFPDRSNPCDSRRLLQNRARGSVWAPQCKPWRFRTRGRYAGDWAPATCPRRYRHDIRKRAVCGHCSQHRETQMPNAPRTLHHPRNKFLTREAIPRSFSPSSTCATMPCASRTVNRAQLHTENTAPPGDSFP